MTDTKYEKVIHLIAILFEGRNFSFDIFDC